MRYKPLDTGAETVRGVQEGFTSALEKVRDLNVRLIGMARANTNAAFDFAREVAEAKAGADLVQAWKFASTSSEPVTRRVVTQGSKRQ